MADFIRDRRSGKIESTDPPGKYGLSVTAKDYGSRLCSKIVATLTKSMFALEHATLGPHTLTWRDTITKPDGSTLPPGSLNMYMCAN